MPKPKKYSIMLAEFPGNNSSHPATNRYIKRLLWKTWRNDKRIGRVRFFDEVSTPISMVRNQAIHECQKHGIDYCFMIDSDMCPDTEAGGKPFWDTSWNSLMERREEEAEFTKAKGEELRAKYENAEELLSKMVSEKFPPATIGAPYCGPPPHENVYVFKWTDYESNTPNPNYMLAQYTRDQVIPYTGIWEVAALPTGLIIYDVRLFATLPQPWFEYEYTDTPRNTHKGSTEDVFQTRNASMLGFPQYCNWDAWAGHIKLKTVCKPEPVRIAKVPIAMAAALRAGVTEEHKVVMIKRGSDLRDEKPQVIAAPKPTPKDTTIKLK